MKKVLFVIASLQPPGGANAVSAWMVNSLKDDHDVTVLTFEPTNLEEIDRFYGTSLVGSKVKFTHVNAAMRAFLALDPDPGSIQPISYMMRLCQYHNHKFDVLIAPDNEIDFGCRGIQYINYPYLTMSKKPWGAVQYAAKHGNWRAFRMGRYRPWMLLSGFSLRRMESNLTLANSHWDKRVIQQYYDIEPGVLYPPVPGVFPEVSWDRKENGFMCVGRYHPDKNIHRNIEILEEVRKSCPDIHLHIVGTPASRDPKAWSDYRQMIVDKAKEHNWISIHENLSREELVELLTTHRYGIHGHETEHFGIAVAEMVQSGCIPFVPNDGGQVEIVGDERLTYANKDEAVEKIVSTLKNAAEQADLQAHLRNQRAIFTTENFSKNFREIVAGF